jgi:hypothetical protein
MLYDLWAAGLDVDAVPSDGEAFPISLEPGDTGGARRAKKAGGNTFAVDRRVINLLFQRSTGVNPPIAYLIQARGSSGDNVTTKWSSEAIAKYSGMSWANADRAVIELVELCAMKLLPSPRKLPRYQITRAHEITGCDGYPPAEGHAPTRLYDESAAQKPQWIWLPNSVICGAAAQRPPLSQLWQRHDPGLVRLLVGLYDAQVLDPHFGIDRAWLCQQYKRQRIGQRGHKVAYQFIPGDGLSVSRSAPFLQPFVAAGSADGGAAFWDALRALQQFGLLSFIPHLTEADSRETEIIRPCPQESEPGAEAIEYALGAATRDEALSVLNEGQLARVEDDPGCLACAPPGSRNYTS